MTIYAFCTISLFCIATGSSSATLNDSSSATLNGSSSATLNGSSSATLNGSSPAEHNCLHNFNCPDCRVPQDVVFLVDPSLSISEPEFKITKTLLVDVHKSLWMPPTRSAVIRFADHFDIISDFSFDRDKVIKAVQNMEYEQGETLLGPPLRAAQNLFLSKERKTVVLITDGDPNDWNETRKGAAELRLAGTRLLIVTVGQAKVHLLKEIASEPVKNHMIRVENKSTSLNATDSLLKLLNQPCPCAGGQTITVNVSNSSHQVPLKELLLHGRKHSRQCTDLSSAYAGIVNLSCANGQLYASHNCTSSCPVQQDIVFLVDSSASVGEPEFSKTKALLVDVHERLWIPPIRSAVIQFDDQHHIISGLSSDRGHLIKNVQGMGYKKGETLLGPPLLSAQSLLNNSTTGISEHKTVVLVTDGSPSDWIDTREKAAAMRGSGVRLAVVMIGKAKTHFVEEIMTKPVQDNLIRVHNYSTLLDTTSSLLRFFNLPCPCQRGQPVFVNFSGQNISLLPPKEMLSGDTDEVLCRDVFSATIGRIQLACRNGNLLAQHDCCFHRRCPAGLSIRVGHESSVADLQVQEGGLDGGSLSMHQCQDHFAGTSGSIGLGCYDGLLQAAVQCTSSEDMVPLWVIPVSCASSAFITALFMFYCLGRRVQKKDNRYLSAIDPG